MLHRSNAAAFLLAALLAGGPPLGLAQDAEDARPMSEREKLLAKGYKPMELPELSNIERQRAQKIDRDAAAGNHLRRNEVNYRRDRVGPVTFNIWSAW